MAWPVFRGLFDDASLFPPASLPMADAVAGHLRHQAAWYREMSGPFVCADTNITELSAALTAAGVAELDLALMLPGGAAGLDAAVDGVFADPRLRLRAVELPVAARDSITIAVEDVAAALDRTPLAGAAAFIEVPARDFTTAAGPRRRRPPVPGQGAYRRRHGAGIPGRPDAGELPGHAGSGAAGIQMHGRAASRGTAPGRGHRFQASRLPQRAAGSGSGPR